MVELEVKTGDEILEEGNTKKNYAKKRWVSVESLKKQLEKEHGCYIISGDEDEHCNVCEILELLK